MNNIVVKSENLDKMEKIFQNTVYQVVRKEVDKMHGALSKKMIL